MAVMVLMTYKGDLDGYWEFAARVAEREHLDYSAQLAAFAGLLDDGSLFTVSIWRSRGEFEELYRDLIAPSFEEAGLVPPLPTILPYVASLIGTESAPWEKGS